MTKALTTTSYAASPDHSAVKSQKVRKAVLPAAGLGTRFLPATKAQPKEMLAVVDKPQIQYVVEECVASGIEHIIIVTGKGKNSIEDHFDSAPALERFLEERGKKDQAEMVRKITNMVQVSYTARRNRSASATPCSSRAIWLATNRLQFARRRSNSRTKSGHQTIDRGLRSYRRRRHCRRRSPQRQNQSLRHRGRRTRSATAFRRALLRIRDLGRETATGKRAVESGHYRAVRSAACNLRLPGSHETRRGNEIQLTDALRILAKEQGLWAYIYDGISYDAGDKLGFLKATVEIALLNPELGAAFRSYLKNS